MRFKLKVSGPMRYEPFQFQKNQTIFPCGHDQTTDHPSPNIAGIVPYLSFGNIFMFKASLLMAYLRCRVLNYGARNSASPMNETMPIRLTPTGTECVNM